MERPVYQMNKQTTEQFLASLDPKLIEDAIKMRRVNKCDIKNLNIFANVLGSIRFNNIWKYIGSISSAN